MNFVLRYKIVVAYIDPYTECKYTFKSWETLMINVVYFSLQLQ